MVASQWKMSSSALGPALHDVGGSFCRSCVDGGTPGAFGVNREVDEGVARIDADARRRVRRNSSRGVRPPWRGPSAGIPRFRFPGKKTLRRRRRAARRGRARGQTRAETHLELLGDALRGHLACASCRRSAQVVLPAASHRRKSRRSTLRRSTGRRPAEETGSARTVTV